MGLIDRVARFFGAAAPQNDRGRTTSDELAAGRGPSPLDMAASLRAALERKQIVKVCREMYAQDTRAEDVIRTLARDMVRGGFSVTIEEAPGGQGDAALEIAEALQDRLHLDQRLDDWLRLTLRDGDSFLELAVDGQMEIVSVSRKPTLEVRRNSNAQDLFDDPRAAFWQGDEWAIDTNAPANAIWYAEWQMIHARWGHDEGSRYGRPLFASAITAYKRMREGETDLAVRRKTRAGLKYLHEFPAGTDEPTILRYKQINKDSLDNPTAAIADFFGTVKISAVQGDAQLGTIDDVMHHIRTWFLASPVPMSLLGYGQDLNRDVLDKQEEQYLRALEGLESWPETEIIRPLLERQWLLKGILPAGLKYRVVWQAKAPLTAAGVALAADAALKLRAIGAPDEAVRSLLAALAPGVEMGNGWGAGARPAPTGGPETQETIATPGRMAQVASEIASSLRSSQ